MRLPGKITFSIQGLVILSALTALLLARVAPSPSLQSLSPRSNTGSLSARTHRPCFDREATDWASPTKAFLLGPQQFVSAETKPALDLQLPFSTKGSHYDRPPPTA